MKAPPTQEAGAPATDAGGRFAASLRPDRSPADDDTAELRRWLAERRAANSYRVRRIPFAELDRWSFDPDTGNLGHDSGQFFTVEGMTARTDYGGVGEWSQPIINQPEIGILGILVKEIDGVIHCLMQAKMEPGNVNMVQLSPTIQATRSNLRRVHKGDAPRYLEYFTGEKRGRLIVDVLQSEQGAWFHAKRNRNMVVEVDGDVPEHPDFRWVPLRQLCRLLAHDDLANMDTRTVLACMPIGVIDVLDAPPPAGQDAEFTRALRRSFGETGAMHDASTQLSWFNEMKLRYDLAAQLVPLRGIRPWRRTDDEISREDGRYFGIVAVSVEASNREVARWTQPLLAPATVGVVAFLTKQINGVLHVLAHARVEAGYRDIVELAPTVQSAPESYGHLPAAARPRYLDYVLSAPADRIRFDAIQSDEGGRLLHARNRHLVVEVDDDFPVETPDDYAWLTVRQLMTFMQRSYHVNIQGRSMAACLYGLS
jgi:dTDP-4-dehydro-6-deoxy-alpha-D-glucopyranose 2,3-dehydratase